MSIPDTEIHRLIRRAQSGKRDAIAQLYRIFAPQIYRFVAYRVPEQEADDITAGVFINMVEGLPSYRITEVPFEGWLYSIATARIADYYRRQARQTLVELSDQMPDSHTLPEEHIIQQEEISRLRVALRQLTDEQQLVLLLRFVERKSHEEVARVLGKHVSAVKSIQHRALVHLTQLLGSESKVRHYLRGKHE